MRGICVENGRILYFGSAAGYVTGRKAVVDPMFKNGSLERFLGREKRIREVEWKEGVYDRLADGRMDVPDGSALKNVRIWQLKPEVDIYMKFISYGRMVEQFGEPAPENYRVVFDGEMGTNDLEEIYGRLNMEPHPSGYTGHSLSMSDIVELYDKEGSEFHYVDEWGFKAVAFDGREPEQEPVMGP